MWSLMTRSKTVTLWCLRDRLCLHPFLSPDRWRPTKRKRPISRNERPIPMFWTSLSSSCPALLRGSFMYGHTVEDGGGCKKKVIRRPLLPVEHFAVQGIPVLLPANHQLSKALPRKLRRRRGCGRGQRKDPGAGSMGGEESRGKGQGATELGRAGFV